MKYKDLRDFIHALERTGELRRVAEPVSVRLEVTAVSDFVLQAGGPALLFENLPGYKLSALTNLFGTTRRVALAMGVDDVSELRDVGHLLANLKEPEPPKGIKDAGKLIRMGKALWDMKPAVVRQAACQQVRLSGDEVDLGDRSEMRAGFAMILQRLDDRLASRQRRLGAPGSLPADSLVGASGQAE